MSRKQGTDTAAFAALLNDLRGPLNGVAATLSKNNGTGGGNKGLEEGDLRKLNFRELAERFEHLSQVLPDALRCVQEVKDLQASVQERLDVLEGRQQSEEAYASSLKELQEAIESQSFTLQEDIKERMGQLRQVLDDREAHLLNKVREVEHEKVAVIERQVLPKSLVMNLISLYPPPRQSAAPACDLPHVCDLFSSLLLFFGVAPARPPCRLRRDFEEPGSGSSIGPGVGNTVVT